MEKMATPPQLLLNTDVKLSELIIDLHHAKRETHVQKLK